MLRKILGLPIRAARRVTNLMDGERSAPSPAPSMPSPSTPAPVAAEPVVALKKAPPPPPDVDVRPEPTPNPNAMKFTVGQKICETGSFSFSPADVEVAHPVARAVLAVDGVKSVFGVNDFVTVTKDDAMDWDTLVPHLVSAIGAGLKAE